MLLALVHGILPVVKYWIRCSVFPTTKMAQGWNKLFSATTWAMLGVDSLLQAFSSSHPRADGRIPTTPPSSPLLVRRVTMPASQAGDTSPTGRQSLFFPCSKKLSASAQKSRLAPIRAPRAGGQRAVRDDSLIASAHELPRCILSCWQPVSTLPFATFHTFAHFVVP